MVQVWYVQGKGKDTTMQNEAYKAYQDILADSYDLRGDDDFQEILDGMVADKAQGKGEKFFEDLNLMVNEHFLKISGIW